MATKANQAPAADRAPARCPPRPHAAGWTGPVDRSGGSAQVRPCFDLAGKPLGWQTRQAEAAALLGWGPFLNRHATRRRRKVAAPGVRRGLPQRGLACGPILGGRSGDAIPPLVRSGRGLRAERAQRHRCSAQRWLPPQRPHLLLKAFDAGFVFFTPLTVHSTKVAAHPE